MRLPPNAVTMHSYIGASSACWSIYSALLIGESPDVITSAHLPRAATHSPTTERALPRIGAGLIADAYAAQHPGSPSPQAIQSVAVHVLTMHGVIERDVASENAMWLRRRPLRERGVFRWLDPPDFSRTLTVADIAIAPLIERASTIAAYVGMVYDAWMDLHRDVINEWYDRYVLADHPSR